MAFPTAPLAVITLVLGGAAAAILVWYLLWRPPLVRSTRLLLLLGLGILPIGAAATGNVQGFEATKSRKFCGSCHVMALHKEDSDNLNSHSLASRHGRNPMFGEENCYDCHADYGMFGTMITKMGGMRHVWLYYTQYRHVPIEQAKSSIKLLAPYRNDNCMQCHSTRDDLWQKVPDHRASLEDVRTGRVSCAGAGCHGLAHPFFRPAEGK
jgi:cytochrome c-type protein NapC